MAFYNAKDGILQRIDFQDNTEHSKGCPADNIIRREKS